MTDLVIAKRMAWKYDWVAELDADVYRVLCEELNKEPDPA